MSSWRSTPSSSTGPKRSTASMRSSTGQQMARMARPLRPFGVIRRRHFFQESVVHRFHFVDKFQDEFEPIEQTFDERAPSVEIAVRLAQRSQLIASITPQGFKCLYAQ